MEYLALYIVLLTFILLSFVRGKHVLFNIIIMTYPTIVIYNTVLQAGGNKMLAGLDVGLSMFTLHLILFLVILCPVYISLFRIVNQFKLTHSLKGVVESVLLSVGIVLLTIGVCFHVLPDTDVFNLTRPFETFFQSATGYFVSVVIPMLSVFLLSKQKVDTPL